MNLVSYNNPKSIVTEAYRMVRTNIDFSSIDKKIKTILVTSTKPNEGKSTVVSNLAVTFASLDSKRVLLIDCDLRNPTIHRVFNISNENGITDILTGQKIVDECIRKSKIDGLDVLSVGTIPPNPSEMLQSNKMKLFLEELKESYDYIFIDSSPVGFVTDASLLAQYADGTIILVGSSEVNIDELRIAKERLKSGNANVIGAILNKFDIKKSTYKHYSDSYIKSQKQKKRLFKKR